MKRYIRYPLIFRIVQSPLEQGAMAVMIGWFSVASNIVGGIWGTGRLPCFADSSRWPWPLHDSPEVGWRGWQLKCVMFFYVALAIVAPLQMFSKSQSLLLERESRSCHHFVHGWSGVPFIAWEDQKKTSIQAPLIQSPCRTKVAESKFLEVLIVVECVNDLNLAPIVMLGVAVSMAVSCRNAVALVYAMLFYAVQ